jgi:hypothetical protein
MTKKSLNLCPKHTFLGVVGTELRDVALTGVEGTRFEEMLEVSSSSRLM